MDSNMDKVRMMQAEMARFENEISGPMLRPPMPRFAPDGTLQFIPHSLHRTPVGATYAPPMPPMAAGRGLRIPYTPNVPGFPRPRLPVIPAPTSSVVIEAAPTKYNTANNPQPNVIGVQPAVYQELQVQATGAGMSSGGTGGPTTSLQAKQEMIRKRTTAKTSTPSTSKSHQAPKKYVRTAGGEIWEDTSLLEWDPNDYRIFCGDLGNEVSDELLAKAFRKYSSFQKAKVIREKRSNKTKGYGFVSFKDPQDFIRALREMDGKYVGNRPIKLRKSMWRERNLKAVKKKEKEKKKLGYKM